MSRRRYTPTFENAYYQNQLAVQNELQNEWQATAYPHYGPRFISAISQNQSPYYRDPPGSYLSPTRVLVPGVGGYYPMAQNLYSPPKAGRRRRRR